MVAVVGVAGGSHLPGQRFDLSGLCLPGDSRASRGALSRASIFRSFTIGFSRARAKREGRPPILRSCWRCGSYATMGGGGFRRASGVPTGVADAKRLPPLMGGPELISDGRCGAARQRGGWPAGSRSRRNGRSRGAVVRQAARERAAQGSPWRFRDAEGGGGGGERGGGGGGERQGGGTGEGSNVSRRGEGGGGGEGGGEEKGESRLRGDDTMIECNSV